MAMAMFHNLNHPGQRATMVKLENSYYWPTMRQDVSRFVKECPDCQACKPVKSIQPPVSHRPVTQARFKDLQVDIVGPLPPSEGMVYLLTIICRTTRWIEAVPLAEATAANCATAMIRTWIQRFGLPSDIRSDNGTQFVSALWKEIHQSLGIQLAFTPPYHPSSLGSIERQHRDLKMGLKTALHAMGDEHGSKWMTALPWVMLGRRTAFQPALDATASELVLGCNPTVPGDFVHPVGPPLNTNQVSDLLEGLRKNAARPPVQTAHNRTPPINYPEGLLDNVTHVYVKRGKTSPLGHSFDGPFPVTRRLDTSCVEIRVGSFANGSPRLEVQHWQNLKPAVVKEGQEPATRVARGRKPAAAQPASGTPPDETTENTSPGLNPEAPEFAPVPVSQDENNRSENTKFNTRIIVNSSVNPSYMRPQRVKRKPDRYA